MEPVKIKPSVDYIETYADFASFAPLPGAEKKSHLYTFYRKQVNTCGTIPK
ncbi:Uncharacterised protein [Escherichia coli]|nr:Uncharacterised protein [Escherichia coli]